jgi:hypothetical protein
LEVVKRSGKDEPMWVTIHKSMEAMPGIPLYSYLYLKGTTTLCLCYYLLGYLFNKIGEQEGGIGSAWKREGGEVAQTMYTHVSKCKNDKIKIFKIKHKIICFYNDTIMQI